MQRQGTNAGDVRRREHAADRVLVRRRRLTVHSGSASRTMPTLNVTANGQVTLRRELLRLLGVQPGQQIEVSLLPGGRIQMCVIQPSDSIDSFIGCVAGKSAKVATLEEIQAAAASGWAGET